MYKKGANSSVLFFKFGLLEKADDGTDFNQVKQPSLSPIR
jgi:hypothetical protein